MSVQPNNFVYDNWRSHSLCPALEEIPKREVQLGKRQVSYRRSNMGRGTKPTLVCLHGIGSSSASWIKQFQTLGSTQDMIAWDMPGYMGSSSIDKTRPQPGDYAEVLRAFLTELEVHQPVLVGHSLGALQALAYAVKYPRDITGLVVANPALGYDHLPCAEQQEIVNKRVNMLRDLGPINLSEQRAANLLSDKAGNEDLSLVRYNMSFLNEEGYERACQMLVAGNAMADAGNYPGPACVITGEQDRVTVPAGAIKLSEEFKNSSLHILGGAGHASYIEKPDDFNNAVLSYVNGLNSEGAH